MFIDSSITSRLAPFEGAESKQAFPHSRVIPLLRTEPVEGNVAFYKHLTPDRSEAPTEFIFPAGP